MKTNEEIESVIMKIRKALMDGQVHFIRQVDDEGQINVLNESFKVGEEFTSEYVWSTVCTRKQKMEVYYRAQNQNAAMLIKEFDYKAG